MKWAGPSPVELNQSSRRSIAWLEMYAATVCPSALPRTQDVLKWIPPNTLASAISATTAEKLGNERVPGLISDVTEIAVFSPNVAARIYAAEPLTVECPEGYSG